MLRGHCPPSPRHLRLAFSTATVALLYAGPQHVDATPGRKSGSDSDFCMVYVLKRKNYKINTKFSGIVFNKKNYAASRSGNTGFSPTEEIRVCSFDRKLCQIGTGPYFLRLYPIHLALPYLPILLAYIVFTFYIRKTSAYIDGIQNSVGATHKGPKLPKL
jgi:hypothetical protein